MAKFSYITVSVRARKQKLIVNDIKKLYRLEKVQLPPIPKFDAEKESFLPDTD